MKERQGYILILSYFFIAFLTVLGAALLQRSSTELDAAERYVQTLQAFHLADAGVDDARFWLRSQPAPPSGINPFDPFNGRRPMTRGQFRVTIDPDDANLARHVDFFTVTAIGDFNGIQIARQVTQILSTDSFARYSYFTNRERLANGSPIWFTSRDHLEGPVHSNDRLNIAGSPVFDGQVTSASSSVNYQNPPPAGGNNPQFNGGLSLNVAPIPLPPMGTQLRTAASSAGGAWYVGNTTITLQSDGTMLVTNPVRGWVNQPQPLPANGAIFVNGGNATVAGTLDGQLTIGTNRDIIIRNNINYADNPQTNPQSNDVLGLVAEQNVVISRSAPSDLQIQASVMALNSSFTVENWWQGPPKGTLSVYGGIIQKDRGPVGTFSSATGNKLSGYSKDYRYDPRFSNLAPPFFPTTGDYNGVLWQEDN